MEKTHLRTRENIFIIKTEEFFMAYDPEEGDKWELNETGAFILKNLTEGVSLEEIRERIVREFGIDQKKAGTSLQEYIEQLRIEGIIR